MEEPTYSFSMPAQLFHCQCDLARRHIWKWYFEFFIPSMSIHENKSTNPYLFHYVSSSLHPNNNNSNNDLKHTNYITVLNACSTASFAGITVLCAHTNNFYAAPPAPRSLSAPALHALAPAPRALRILSAPAPPTSNMLRYQLLDQVHNNIK